LTRLVDGFNRMSSELAASKHELVRTARLAAWEEVARRLAHEIKNPLTPITLSIHRLRRRTTADPVADECFATILAETAHLERLANEFAQFARLPKPELRPVDAAIIVRQVLELSAVHPGVEVGAELDDMPRVSADGDQLRQVCTNVVKNAIEAMPAGGRLHVHWEALEGDRVALLFDDEGPGLEVHSLPRVFEPTFTTKASGTGLGLAIVKRIVEDHGGSIRIENRAGGGARVRVELRRAPP
jgi:nitrogen fixation/metabolism regulation signal transduction histidine kinase